MRVHVMRYTVRRARHAFLVQHAEPHETFEGGAVVRRHAVAQAVHHVLCENGEPLLAHGGSDDVDVGEVERVHLEHEFGRVEQLALLSQVKLLRSAVPAAVPLLTPQHFQLLAHLVRDHAAASRLVFGLIRRLLDGFDQIDQAAELHRLVFCARLRRTLASLLSADPSAETQVGGRSGGVGPGSPRACASACALYTVWSPRAGPWPHRPLLTRGINYRIRSNVSAAGCRLGGKAWVCD